MRAALLAIFVMAAAHAGARPAEGQRNACDVLTRADVAAVQGQAYAEKKHSNRGVTSQCFYRLPAFADSVSLDVTRGNGRELWRERFDREEEEEEREEGKKEHPPLRVRGVGDEAYWVGGQLAGSLYVLRGDAVLRVSVGGKGTNDEKLAKSKTLAKKALRRL